MYDKVRMSVKSEYEETEDFTVNIGIHQGLAMSPYLFSLVMDKLTKGVQNETS